jgi:hypothetical protein
MDPLAVARRCSDAWNRRDPEAIRAVLAEDGTDTNPIVPGGLDAQATAEYAAGLFAAFPDLAFAVGSTTAGDDGTVWAEWTMTGTNGGSFQSLPPTGRAVRRRQPDRPGGALAAGARGGARVLARGGGGPARAPGFISWLGAMRRFFGPELAHGGQTWALHRLNGMWVRCDACGEVALAEDAAACACGAGLPEPSAYW